MSDRVPRMARWIVALLSAWVPVRRRDAWRSQWAAELEHRARAGVGSLALVRFALGALPHAAYLRREDMRMRGWALDLRHSLRGLVRRPGFSLLTMGTLAIGIGTASAVFSLAEAMLLRTLPQDDAGRLVRIFSTNAERGFGRFSVSFPDYRDFTAREDLFASASFYTTSGRDLSGEGDPERIRTAAVYRDYFQTLATPSTLGRTFANQEHDPGSVPTTVLAESFWARRFAADTAVSGREIRLDGVPHVVIGVVPDTHAWPVGTDAWTPLQWGTVVPDYADGRTNHTWQVVGRLRDGVPVEDASEQVQAMAASIYSRPEVDEAGTRAVVVHLGSSEGGEGAAELFGTLGTAVFVVLLIACMNASGLLVTRTWSRARELSLRAALGAGRTRLAGILFGESALLALVGGMLGVWLGHVGLARALASAPPEVQDLGEVRLNGVVIAAGAGISLLAALMAGLIPALRAARISVAQSLRDGAGQTGQGWGLARLRRVLVVGELSLALALLVAAGLAVRGFQRQIATNPGFEAEGLVSFTVRLPATRYPEPALVDDYYREAVARLEARPGVLAATSTSRLPLGAGGVSLTRAFIFDGAVPPPDGDAYSAAWIEVDPGYFETLGVRPLEGRVLTSEDGADGEPVALVTREMARRMSPEESIVGRSIRSHYDENVPRRVVGVIPDLQINGVARTPLLPLVFVPRAQAVRTAMAFLVRTSGDADDALPAIRAAMTELDPDVALDELQPLRRAHAADLGGIRFLTTLFGAFGVLALILAVGGVYGLVSYSVSQQRQGIGVRIAMGATARRVRREILAESARLSLVGLALGSGLAWVAARVLAAGMSGVATPEPSTFIGVAAVLVTAVLAASWLPATRAGRVDPVDALRSD